MLKFKRVAAIVHHDGAPQALIPQHYDQHYWAGRIQQLSLGIAHTSSATPTIDSLTSALKQMLQRDVTARAKVIADKIRTDGTLVAA